MKIILSTLVMVLMVSFNAFAAVVTIPSISMTRVDGYFVATEGNKALLVTSGGNATLNSSGNTLVIEKGGSAIINGDNETVYLKSGGSLVINGANNTVYYENGVELTAAGEGSKTVQVDSFSS